MKVTAIAFVGLLCALALLNSCSKDATSPTQPQGSTTAAVSGTVFRQGTTVPVVGAIVTVGSARDTTNSSGKFQLSLLPGSYSINAVAPKYSDFYGSITINSVAPVTYDSIAMRAIPWEFVGNTIAIPGPTGWEFATGMNNTIYFATPNNSGSQQHFIAYDLATNTYLEKSLTGNNVCACGYMSDLAAASNRLFYFANNGDVYTPVTNSWTPVNYPAANKRGEAGVAVFGDDIYYVGGRGPLNTSEVYNVTTNAWRNIANYLYATDWAAAVSYNSLIYVLGGSSALNKMSRYTPATNSWTALADIPFPNLSSRPRAVVFDKKIFFFSGSDIYQYDLVSSSWSASIMSSSGYGSIPVVVGDTMYLIGYSSTRSGYALAKYTP
jgi:hypothetical protein